MTLANASEAARITGVPRTTISSWIRREQLFPAGLEADGTKLYDLDSIRMRAGLPITRPQVRHAARPGGR